MLWYSIQVRSDPFTNLAQRSVECIELSGQGIDCHMDPGPPLLQCSERADASCGDVDDTYDGANSPHDGEWIHLIRLADFVLDCDANLEKIHEVAVDELLHCARRSCFRLDKLTCRFDQKATATRGMQQEYCD